MQKFVSNRDIVVRSSKAAMAIRFQAGVPQEVPRAMHAEVLDKGIMAVDEDGKSVDHVEVAKANESAGPKLMLAPEDAGEREDKVVEVIRELVKRNNSKEFTGGGVPKASVISQVLGWTIDQKDVKDIWVKHRTEIVVN